MINDLGRVDVVVSNAGYGLFRAAEKVTDDQVRQQIDTNLVDSIALVRACLPHLRRQGGGRIEDGRSAPRTVALFAEDQTAPVDDEQVIQIRLKDLKCVTRDNGVKPLIVWLMPSNIKVELQSGL